MPDDFPETRFKSLFVKSVDNLLRSVLISSGHTYLRSNVTISRISYASGNQLPLHPSSTKAAIWRKPMPLL